MNIADPENCLVPIFHIVSSLRAAHLPNPEKPYLQQRKPDIDVSIAWLHCIEMQEKSRILEGCCGVGAWN